MAWLKFQKVFMPDKDMYIYLFVGKVHNCCKWFRGCETEEQGMYVTTKPGNPNGFNRKHKPTLTRKFNDEYTLLLYHV